MRTLQGGFSQIAQYVKRKQRTSSEDYVFTTEYAAIISELEKHGFEIATSESVAQRLFSENIIPKLRNMLDRLAKEKISLKIQLMWLMSCTKNLQTKPSRRQTDMAKRNAAGAGSIRKKTVLRDAREYTYWEARLTVGVDPGTGKQIRRSFSGKTQKEVREKMQAAAVTVNDSTYQEPTKLTVSDWLDIWLAEYTGDVKPLTRSTYKNKVESAIKPVLGAVKLQALKAPQIQKMLNDLQRGTSVRKSLSAKTVKDIYGILHRALEQAVEVGYLRINPSDACKLPRVERAEIKPLDEVYRRLPERDPRAVVRAAVYRRSADGIAARGASWFAMERRGLRCWDGYRCAAASQIQGKGRRIFLRLSEKLQNPPADPRRLR
ncbi:MAG: N-terminal phage integrase SAM-like domain-containing protein [Oscillospiraceae bacterium]